jgi:NitT/TauT family transport system substrate-binding protein
MKRNFAILTSLVVLAGLLSGCFGQAAATPSPTATQPQQTATPEPTASSDRPEVNFTVLIGPTGVGAAKLMADNDAGNTANDYHFTVASTNDEVVAKLASGETDIAAIATNVAANLYHKTDGDVQIAAINTLGVLHILERGTTLKTMAGLKGKTIYTTGQGANPEYVLNYLLAQNGLTPGKDVTIVWKSAEEVSALMLSQEADVCMLPEPAATALVMKSLTSSKSNAAVRKAIDLSQEWEDVSTDSVLTMGCVVVRTAFAKEHHDVVSAFLEEYAASIDYVRNNAEPASALVAQYGITASAAIAQSSIPGCNLTCITGTDVRDDIQGYYEVLYAANPASIGGSIPDDAFYFIP